MIIQIDSREKKNNEVIEYFDKIGQKYFVSKIAGADYIDFKNPQVAIDLKANLLELANNLTRKHAQFKNEIKMVQESMECEFCVLIREPIEFEDIKNWSNKNTQLKGEQLYKIMKTMEERYKIHWFFCSRYNAGEKIIKILKKFSKMV